MVGLALLASVAVGVTEGARGAGAAFGGNVFGVALLALACFYGKAGRGLRVTSIVIAGVQILLGLSATLRGNIGGPIALVGAVVVVVLLSQASAGAWFRGPRTPGAQREGRGPRNGTGGVSSARPRCSCPGSTPRTSRFRTALLR
ncbi:hypothetical protein [Streptomyces sp. NPDC055400]